MRIIDRHIARTVLLATLVVISLAVSVELIFGIAEELSDIDDNYTILHALFFVLQVTPTIIYELLPFAALGGALIGLGILASNNELVVIQAAGVKIWRIVWSVMKPTLLIMLLGLLLGEYVAPRLELAAQSNRDMLQSGSKVFGSDEGSWQKIGNEFIHINAIAPGGQILYGVSRYLLDDNRNLHSSSFAEYAEFNNSGQDDFWQLYNVVETQIATAKITTSNHSQLSWNIDLSPELLSVLLVEPKHQSISGLYQFAEYFDREGLEAGNYYLAFWGKLLQPLATAALVLLSVSFVFGPLREATLGYRIFVAIFIGLTFTILQRLLDPASLLYGFSPIIAVLIPILLSASLGVYFLQRVR